MVAAQIQNNQVLFFLAITFSFRIKFSKSMFLVGRAEHGKDRKDQNNNECSITRKEKFKEIKSTSGIGSQTAFSRFFQNYVFRFP